MSKDREARSDVQLSEELSHVSEMPQGRDFFEANGTVLRGESEGNEVCLEFMAWHFGGGKQGKWMVDDATVGQTNFSMVPKDRKGRMQDNDFVSNRLDPTEWVGNIHIEKKPDEIIWHVGNRQFISRPPYWELRGEHMGVACNLTLGGMGNATRVYGLWSDLPTVGHAGYEQRCWAEGTITVKGRTYTLEEGYASHGVLIFGETYDQVEAMRDPYHYIWCLNESSQIFLYTQPGSGVSYSRLYTDGHEISFGQGEITVNELELWTDPRTAMRVPIRWHVNMNSEGGVVDMNIAALGRSIFCVLTRWGYTVRYSFSARANGRAFLPGGQSVQFEDMLTYLEWGRTAMPLEGGAP